MTRRFQVRWLLLVLLLCALGAESASAQAPLAPSLTLDTAFAPPTGIARDNSTGTLTDNPGGVAVDGDRIYTVGESNGEVVIIARKTNGVFDNGFSGDGRLDLVLGNGRDIGTAIVVLPDHRLRILASTDVDPTAGTNIDVALIGLNADGTDDMSFGGGDGRVIFPVGTGSTEDNPTRMTSDGAGRLAIVGYTKDSGVKEDSFLALRSAVDGSQIDSFDGDGLKILQRGANNLNDRGIDIAFRPGGGLIALLQVATTADAASNFAAVLHALDDTGTDDTRFSEDGDLVLAVGDPSTIPGGLIAHKGRLWATGNTKVAADTDAWVARVEADGTGMQFRRFDMRGGRIADTEAVVSGGVDLAVLAGNPETLVIVGSIAFSNRTIWAAAAFNGIDGALSQMGYDDELIPTEEFGSLVGVAAGADFLASTGSLLNLNGNFDTTIGTVRFLVDAEKRCDLGVEVTQPLEVIFEGKTPEAVTVRVTNNGTKSCAGVISVPSPYKLRLGASASAVGTGVLAPGASYVTGGAVLSYDGPRRPEDVLAVRVKATGDINPANDVSLVNVIFSYCDIGLRREGSMGLVPNEGFRRFEFSLQNLGTSRCRRVRVAPTAGVRARGTGDSFTVEPGHSSSDDILAAVTGPRRVGRKVRLVFRARGDADVDPTNDTAAVPSLIIGVGDTSARTPRSRARRLAGRATPGRGPITKRRLRLTRVHVAVRRLGRGCHWLASHDGRLRKRSARRCNAPVWLTAEGTKRWSFAIPAGLPRGRYRLLSRATIAAGGFKEASFSARDRNRVAFRVR